MAFAYPGPAPDGNGVPSPNRSAELPAGPGFPLPRRTVDLLAIAQGFGVSANSIPELQGLSKRTWLLLAVTDLFEAWAIGWPAGGTIELHDHGLSSGAVVVTSGCLTETTVRPTNRGVALIASRSIEAGQHRTFGPRYIHDLTNHGDEQAMSVHVYSPRLTSMAYYRVDQIGKLVPRRVQALTPVGPFDVTAAHDPS
jgi:hypothetical protein